MKGKLIVLAERMPNVSNEADPCSRCAPRKKAACKNALTGGTCEQASIWWNNFATQVDRDIKK